MAGGQKSYEKRSGKWQGRMEWAVILNRRIGVGFMKFDDSVQRQRKWQLTRTPKCVSLIAFITSFNYHISCEFGMYGQGTVVCTMTLVQVFCGMSQYMKGRKCLKCFSHQLSYLSRCLIWARVYDFPGYPVFIWQRTMVPKFFPTPDSLTLFFWNKLFLIVEICPPHTGWPRAQVAWVPYCCGCTTDTGVAVWPQPSQFRPSGGRCHCSTNNVSCQQPTLSPIQRSCRRIKSMQRKQW